MPRLFGASPAAPARTSPGRDAGRHQPDSIHIATASPIGWATRAYCQRRSLAFTSSHDSELPLWLHDQFELPLGLCYALLRHFHKPSRAVLVRGEAVRQTLRERGFLRARCWPEEAAAAHASAASEADVDDVAEMAGLPLAHSAQAHQVQEWRTEATQFLSHLVPARRLSNDPPIWTTRRASPTLEHAAWAYRSDV